MPSNSKLARLSDAEWCETGVVHHSTAALRVSWKGVRIMVKDDARVTGLRPKTRAAHGRLHKGAAA